MLQHSITLIGDIFLSNSPIPINKVGKKKRVLIILVSILLFIIGAAALLGGAAVLYFNMGTDNEGYALSEKYEIKTSANAFALWVAPLRITGSFSWLGYDNIAATKWVVTASEPGQEIFAGWAKASNIEPYVSKFSYESPDFFWSWRTIPYAPEIDIPSTSILNQGNPARPPAQEGFWLKTATTTNSTAIYWDPIWDSNKGMNVIVIMNSDASSGINADIQLGYKVPILTWLPYLLIPLGIILLVFGLLLFKRRKKP
jgi:hypothetical protein